VCRPNEWDNIGEEYDNMWSVLDKSGESSVIAWFVCTHFFILTRRVFFFQPRYAR